MKNWSLLDNLVDGLRTATEKDTNLVTLTLAQAFADYKYPIPTTDVSYSALLQMYYEFGS